MEDGLMREAPDHDDRRISNDMAIGEAAQMAGITESKDIQTAPAMVESARSDEDGRTESSLTVDAVVSTNASQLPSPLPSPHPLPASSSAPSTAPFPLLATHDAEADFSSLPSSSSSSIRDKDGSSGSSAVSDTPQTPRDAPLEEPRRSGSLSLKKTLSTDSGHVRRLSAAGMQSLTAAPESLPIAVVGSRERSPEKSSTRRNSAPTKLNFEVVSALPTPVEGPAVPPLPPMSLPTHLQLELAAQRPSPLYILGTPDVPYESNAVKFERLKNVLLLPPYLERAVFFGALACLDAWLHTFTILPIRFCLAVNLLVKWWLYVIANEVRWLIGFVWYGLGRLWSRTRKPGKDPAGDESTPLTDAPEAERSESTPDDKLQRTVSNGTVGDTEGIQQKENGHTPGRESEKLNSNGSAKGRKASLGIGFGGMRHRRTKSLPSNLSSFHKADLLQGAVVILSSIFLMNLDASRMYHFIRAQSAIKLYVIYNALEVGDRLLSAIGQDIFECLFSSETLSRNSSGRSKVLEPLGMFVLALTYNFIHSVALYYQVITLNVAVNSYSNALLTLLISNQFVEIKSTVFKRFEKDNLFQLTCADIVERFQIWIMLLIIAMRNIVEVGGISVPGAGLDADDVSGALPLHSPSILPHSFTVLPSWLWQGEVLSPFLIVIGSEMIVDIIKHAYVTKFNQIKPTFYSRILDILCKDYYTNAFMTPTLTRRLGLAVIPLSCLFIRASVQTYHMFLSTHVPPPIPQSAQTSLSVESSIPTSPAMMEALSRIDSLLRDALGRAVYGYPYEGVGSKKRPWWEWNSDDAIAAVTMIVVFFIAFLVLLILKLLLGMVLLRYSRYRYTMMRRKEQLVAAGKAERESYDARGKRVGGYGHIEVTEDRRRWIHADRTEGLKSRERKTEKPSEGEYRGVYRYDMVAKRIW